MASTPQISIVTPVYNDPEGIADTLESLPLAREDAEFLIVDNGSTDQTASVVETFEREYETVQLLHEPGEHSQFAARNTAIRSAESDLFAFVDADMLLPDSWLDDVLDAFGSTGADYMAANVEVTMPENPSFAAQYDHHTGFPVKEYIETKHFAPTCCLTIHRSVFEDIGLFDHRLHSGGDVEFGTRAHAAGYEIYYAPEITMYHPARENLQALISKASRVGRGHCQLQRYHPERFGTPGTPPRPSGIKRPSHELSLVQRLAFDAFSTILTGIRGMGYYREYVEGTTESHEPIAQLADERR